MGVLFSFCRYLRLFAFVSLVLGLAAVVYPTGARACCSGGGGGGESLDNLRKRMMAPRKSRRYIRRKVRRRAVRRSTRRRRPARPSRKRWVKVKDGPVPEYTWGDPSRKAFLPRWVKVKDGPVPEYRWGWETPSGFVPMTPTRPQQGVRRRPSAPAPSYAPAGPTQTYASPAPLSETYGGSWRPPDYKSAQPQQGWYPRAAPLMPPQKPVEISPYAVAAAKTANETFGVLVNGVTGKAAKAAQVAGYIHSTVNAGWNSKGITSDNEKEFDEAVDNGIKSALEFAFGGLGAAGGATAGPGGAVIGGYLGGKLGDAVHDFATVFGEVLSKDGFAPSPGGPGPAGGVASQPTVNR